MAREANKTLVRRYFEELMNKGDLSVADEICSADVVFCDPLLTIKGVDRLKRFLLMVRKSFPDLHYFAEDAIVEGDRAAICFSFRGTLSVPELQIGATSERHFCLPGVNIFRMLGGRIAEVRSFYNAYDQWQQLALFPKAELDPR
jgi:ketosteroid isomerase-like protein